MTGSMFTFVKNTGVWHPALYCCWLWWTDSIHYCFIVAKIPVGCYGNYRI